MKPETIKVKNLVKRNHVLKERQDGGGEGERPHLADDALASNYDSQCYAVDLAEISRTLEGTRSRYTLNLALLRTTS